jgi:hypothetical protein
MRLTAHTHYLLRLLGHNVNRPRAWLNSYVQHKKMVGKNTHQVQLGRKSMILFHLLERPNLGIVQL